MLSDWKETCEKCMDGETEPYHCEYYGEPNGCNSPTYGEHPTYDKSSQVGDMAAMRVALSDACHAMFNFLKTQYGSCYEEMAKALDKAKQALAKPPRNCDVMSLNDARKVWFLNEIMPRLDGKLPLGKEKPFDEWFVSQLEQ